MTLVMLSPSLAWPVYLLCLAVTVGALALFAYDARPRLTLAALLCLVLTLWPLASVVRAEEVVVYSDCEGLTPSDWQYWTRGCWAR